MSVSPLLTISHPSGTLKGPLPKWPPSFVRFLILSLTLAPQESASPPPDPQIWWGEEAAAVSRLPPLQQQQQQQKRFLKVAQSWAANVGKQDVCFWLSYLLFFSWFSATFRHYYSFLFDQSLLCFQEKQLSSSPLSFLLSLSLPLVLQLIIHVAFTTSHSVCFCLGCFEKSVIFYLFYSYMSLFLIPLFPLHPHPHFIFFFSIFWGLLLKINPIFYVYFWFKLEQIFSFLGESVLEG